MHEARKGRPQRSRLRVQREQRGPQAPPRQTAPLAEQAWQGLLVRQGRRAQMGPQEQPGKRALWVLRGSQEPPGYQVQRVHRVLPDLPALLVLLGQRELLGPVGPLGQRGLLEAQGPLVPQVQAAR